MEEGTWQVIALGSQRIGHDLATKTTTKKGKHENSLPFCAVHIAKYQAFAIVLLQGSVSKNN